MISLITKIRLEIQKKINHRAANKLAKKVIMPPVLVIVVTACAGINSIIEYIEKNFLVQYQDELFLSGLHGWFPAMNNQTDRVLRDVCGQTASYHAQLLVKKILKCHDGKFCLLLIDSLRQRSQYPSVLDTVQIIFPSAIFLHVIGNPVKEFALIALESNLSAIEFAVRWREAVREWLAFGRQNPQNYYIFSAQPALSTAAMQIDLGYLLMKINYKPEQSVLRWQSIQEVTNHLAVFLKQVGFSEINSPELFQYPESNRVIAVQDQETILKTCVWEMIILRQISIGSSYIFTGAQNPKDVRVI